MVDYLSHNVHVVSLLDDDGVVVDRSGVRACRRGLNSQELAALEHTVSVHSRR